MKTKIISASPYMYFSGAGQSSFCDLIISETVAECNKLRHHFRLNFGLWSDVNNGIKNIELDSHILYHAVTSISSKISAVTSSGRKNSKESRSISILAGGSHSEQGAQLFEIIGNNVRMTTDGRIGAF